MQFDPKRSYSDDDIERAMATVARVIELHGEAYWPILERLEAELESRRARSARLARHLKRFALAQGRRRIASPRGRPPCDPAPCAHEVDGSCQTTGPY
ncbi:hypothetical protein FF098_004220 [Parvularcula flava]|uniref:Uncharacterized protein n=1 Tax=Aquisalinus luteolus TaxID=1566827 RepID=A0A8J3EQ85_9PROT|nr:hypothetical protein [Aquisalinus luteolus]NHK27109.1 hypothetical protein [Aquisalinus luteolus]GGH94401.1 hypothetical protein GCM10011355_08500 [Aquisalinus luteolus]